MTRANPQLAAISHGARRLGVLATVPVVFLTVPPLAHVPARLVSGCPRWIALAGILELGSIAGFVAAFAWVFGAGMTRRQSVMAALRALGASTVLPAGGLVGPTIGVRSTDRRRAPVALLVRSTVAFTILTNAPGVAVLAVFAGVLSFGWPAGPHHASLTLPAAAVAVALIVFFWRLGRPTGPAVQSPRDVPRPLRWITSTSSVLRGGAAEARAVLAARDLKLLCAPLAYYAFDNAVLWATFHAYGNAPRLGVIVMGYLVGSLAAAAPIPGGLGAVEGGLIGALVLYGAPAGHAAGAVLLYRGLSLGLAVSLGAAAWALKLPLRGERIGEPRNHAVRATARPHSIIPRHSRPQTTINSVEVHAGP